MSILTSPEAIIKDKTAVEAGYVNDPTDLGGETIYGITRTTANEDWAKAIWPKYNFNGDMKTMPKQMAYELYRIGWWDRLRLSEVAQYSWPLAERLFDFGINAGRVNCAQSFQRVLNALNNKGKKWPDINPLGTTIGPVTIGILKQALEANRSDPQFIEKLTMMMFSMQNYHYVNISEQRPDNEKFTQGWVNRVWRDFNYYAAWLSGK